MPKIPFYTATHQTSNLKLIMRSKFKDLLTPVSLISDDKGSVLGDLEAKITEIKKEDKYAAALEWNYGFRGENKPTHEEYLNIFDKTHCPEYFFLIGAGDLRDRGPLDKAIAKCKDHAKENGYTFYHFEPGSPLKLIYKKSLDDEKKTPETEERKGFRA